MLEELPVRPVRPHQYGGQLASLDSRSQVGSMSRRHEATASRDGSHLCSVVPQVAFAAESS